jgi:putative transposase
MRNMLAHVPKVAKSIVADAIRTIFAERNEEAGRQQLGEVVGAMESRWPKAAAVLAGGEEVVLATMSFPQEHWTRVYSTNPLERLKKEVQRRINVVGIFPNTDAVLLEIHEEWQVGRRTFSQESMRKMKALQQVALSHVPALRLAPIH